MEVHVQGWFTNKAVVKNTWCGIQIMFKCLDDFVLTQPRVMPSKSATRLIIPWKIFHFKSI